MGIIRFMWMSKMRPISKEDLDSMAGILFLKPTEDHAPHFLLCPPTLPSLLHA